MVSGSLELTSGCLFCSAHSHCPSPTSPPWARQVPREAGRQLVPRHKAGSSVFKWALSLRLGASLSLPDCWQLPQDRQPQAVGQPWGGIWGLGWALHVSASSFAALIPKVNPEVFPDSGGVPGSPRRGRGWVVAAAVSRSRGSRSLRQLASQAACVLPPPVPHAGSPGQAASGPSGAGLGAVRVLGTGIPWERCAGQLTSPAHRVLPFLPCGFPPQWLLHTERGPPERGQGPGSSLGEAGGVGAIWSPTGQDCLSSTTGRKTHKVGEVFEGCFS